MELDSFIAMSGSRIPTMRITAQIIVKLREASYGTKPLIPLAKFMHAVLQVISALRRTMDLKQLSRPSGP
jgi:hypothetical protein